MIKELTKDQKEYIKNADSAIIFLEEQVEQMGSYDEEKKEQEAAVKTIKDFICWSLNNIREPERLNK